MKKATVRDIARMANVSVATVSLVLNNRDHKISPATRDRVLQAAKSLNYQPSATHSLRMHRTGVLGLMIPSITNPYNPMIARGVEEAAMAAGYSVIICNTFYNPRQELQIIELFIQKRVDGIIMAAIPGEAALSLLEKNPEIKNLSFTRHGNVKVKNFDFLIVDNFQGGYMAVEHLLELGHRKIAYVGRSVDRQRGFRQAFTDRGLELDPNLVLMNETQINVVIGEDVVDLGFSLTKKLLREHPETTAIFAYNDLAAFGAIMAVKEAGLKIPEDISIIGYDNITYAALSDPSLTTVDQPKYERGKDAVATLLARINNLKTDPVDMMYRPRLIIRKSTGPVRKE